MLWHSCRCPKPVDAIVATVRQAHRMWVGAVGLRCCVAEGLAACGDSSMTAITACKQRGSKNIGCQLCIVVFVSACACH